MFDFAPFVLVYWAHWAESQQSLQAAVAEANRLDAGWRYEDFQARRPKLADKDNGALQVLAVLKAMPKKWQDFSKTLKFPNERKLAEDERRVLIEEFERRLHERSPPTLLNHQEIAAIDGDLKLLARAYEIVQDLRKFSHGRYPVKDEGPDSMNFQALQAVRQVANMLQYEGLAHAHHNRLGAALQSCQTMIHGARLVGEEPEPIALLVRVAIAHIACDTMERVLAKGETSEAILLLTQKRLAEEEAAFSLVEVARYQRAANHRLFENVRTGKKSLKDLLESFRSDKLDEPTPADFLVAAHTSGLERTEAAVLRRDSRVVGSFKVSEEKLLAAVEGLNELPKVQWLGAEFRNSMMQKVGIATLRGRMILRTAQSALAVERYRLAKGKWPAKLGDLVPAYLPRVPMDYYAGKVQIKLGKFGQGVVVYSVGQDGKDNGGRLRYDSQEENINYPEGLDIGFRLWEVNARRQPPGPPLRIPDAEK